MAYDERLHALALAAANIGTWHWDIRTNQVSWSDNIEAMFGLQKGQFDGSYNAFLELLPSGDRQRLTAAIERSLTSDIPYEIEHRLIWPNGDSHWYLGKGSVLRDASGQPIEMLGTTQDITERKLAEQERHDSNARFRSIIDASPVPYALNDEHQNITYLNPAFTRTFGYTRDDIPTLADWWPRAYPDPHYRQWVAAQWTTRLEQARRGSGGFEQIELNICCKDGGYKSVIVSAASLDEAFAGVHLVVLYDITERKQAEQERYDSDVRFHSVITVLAEGVVVQDRNDRILTCNQAAERILGLTRDQLMGLSSLDSRWHAVHEDGSPFEPRHHPSVITLRTGKPQQDVIMGVHKPDDSLTWISINSQPMFNPGEALPYGVVVSFHDVTERKKTSIELEQHRKHLELLVAERTRKLEALNTELEAFSYAVSHDLRAPLRAVDGFAQILAEDYAEQIDQQGKDYLRRLRAAAIHMNELIDAMLNLSRLTRGELQLTDVDLSGYARSIMQALREASPGRNVQISIENDITVKGDAATLHALLQNLLENAWKYTRRNPAAHIEFGRQFLQAQPVYYVRDNGTGFDMAYAHKLFGAFQRLHRAEDFEGIGIGLATAQRIVHRHGGKIWAEGEVKKGATFYFTLG